MQNPHQLSDVGEPMLLVYSGSISYGTNLPTSDVDKRGIFVPYTSFLLGTKQIYEFRDQSEADTLWFTLMRFLELALECNPNVVEQLFVHPKHVIYCNEYGKELLAMREEFLTKNAFSRFIAYAQAQLERIDNKGNHGHHGTHKVFIDQHGWDTKHGMHLIRLLEMGLEILKYGTLTTLRPNTSFLLDIRGGKYSLDYVKNFAKEKEQKLVEAMRSSTIPDVPNFDKVNKWCIGVVDRIHGKDQTKGVFPGVDFNLLPLEYEMVDKCTLFLTANRLVRKMSTDNAMGVAVPYKDWYYGLRKFTEFRFGETDIDTIHKAVGRMKSCNPRMIDTVFAGEKYFLHDTELGQELRTYMKGIVAKKPLKGMVTNFTRGNLSEMQHWEKLKAEWTGKTEFPPVPKKTDPVNSSMMYKYGYDTLKAFDMVHTLRLGIELAKTGTIVDSRAYESELYAIKHGEYATFEDFNKLVQSLLTEFNEAIEHTPLPEEVNHNEVDHWVQEFIARVHETL